MSNPDIKTALPKPRIRVDAFGDITPVTGNARFVMGDFYDADQMRAYAKAAVLSALAEKDADAVRNYAVVNGKTYPVKFEGYDRSTYKHKSGCLADRNSHDVCCCGALDRATSVWSASIPGKAALLSAGDGDKTA